jgi:hypothetical protein
LTDVLGFKLDVAVQTLEQAGYKVKCLPVYSRKGIANADEARVIRQRFISDNEIELTYSEFKTGVTLP